MIAIAHFIAISCYIGAAALAATPFARPVAAPVRGVLALLGAGVLAHIAGLVAFTMQTGQPPLMGLGPALSFAGLLIALSVLVTEMLARDVSLTLLAAPLAALPTAIANIIGLRRAPEPTGVQGAWLAAHIALSFLGIAAFATAATAGAMYLAEHRELKSRRFGALFRFFPPLETLDRVNYAAAVAGWLGLTMGIVLAVAYSFAYHEVNLPQIVWGTAAWLAVSALALGRVVGVWQARRAAALASIAFVAVVALYVAIRISIPAGKFL